jgi:glycyl-tRNA synthetase
MKEKAKKIERLFKRKFFITPTACIYGGVSGLYDYGPYFCMLRTNVISLWRDFFIHEEGMFEIDTSILAPYCVMKASGHVDKFSDLLVFDKVNGECYRADHLIEAELRKRGENEKMDGILENLGCMKPAEIDRIIQEYEIRSDCGNELGNATSFNLMFETHIGPKTQSMSFLRPETAQGHFVNFKKLYEFNNEKLPFASATIGKVFRNEISPRSGILRVREFEQAEIEYFVDPKRKEMKKFRYVEDIELKLLFSKGEDGQEIHEMRLKDAVQHGIIDNEVLGYFIGRTFLFLKMIGIDTKRLRFRQHKKDEMAHYARDCWDAEIYTSHGWIECVGIADRSCYDLDMHQKHSGQNLKARRVLQEPVLKEEWSVIIDKRKLGARLKKDLPRFEEEMGRLKQSEIEEMLSSKTIESVDTSEGISKKFYQGILEVMFEGAKYEVEVKKVMKRCFVEEITPNVVEPSFGIERILYSLMEHAFWTREDDEDRNVLSFNPLVSPVKCVVTLLRSGDEFETIMADLEKGFKGIGFPFVVCDRNISIGRKYASNDEIGVCYFVTVDPESVTDGKATIRERDSTEQIRLALDKIPDYLRDLCNGAIKWNCVFEKYGIK